MEGYSLCLVVRELTFENDLPDRVELFSWGVDVLLVDFISHNQDLVVVAEPDDIFKAVITDDLASRVPGVDDCQCLDLYEPPVRLVILFLQVVQVNVPSLLFVEVIRDESGVVQGQQGGVEGVLGNRHHDSVVRILDYACYYLTDHVRCTGRHEDGLCIHAVVISYPVSLHNEPLDILSYELEAVILRVGSNVGTDVIDIVFGPIFYIWVEIK